MSVLIDRIEKQSDKSLFLILFFVAFAVRIYASFTSIAQLYPDEILNHIFMKNWGKLRITSK